MSINMQCTQALIALADLKPAHTKEQVLSVIDLTLLDKEAEQSDINKLTEAGIKYQTAALCVYPQHLNWIEASLPIKRATVVNFPTGNDPHSEILKAIEHTIEQNKPNEIDYVFSYQDYLNGSKEQPLKNCLEAYNMCKKSNVIFKVILETGAFPSISSIYELSYELINQGCDFLKTSTGKIEQGASLEAVFAMLNAIKDTNDKCGIKISGGIKAASQAHQYILLAEMMLTKKINSDWFRIGASTLVNNL